MTQNQKSSLSILAQEINDPFKHASIIGDLSLSIKQSIESPSFNQMIHSGANKEQIENLLAVLIVKYSGMLSVGGNLRQGQAIEIAKSVIIDNPSMSLDDFNILLSNGVKGRYNEPGKLFRFDISVIYDWIRAYQEEFWEVKENAPKQKTALELATPEVVSQIQEVIMKAPDRIVMPLTEQDIKREGREKPIKPKYVPPDREFIVMQELRKQYARECTNLHTGRVIEGQPSFDEWLLL